MPMPQRIGILGGSFDPIHIGHLIIAQDAQEQFQLDSVLFIPAHQAPLKSKRSTATPQQRWRMTQLAVENEPCFVACDIEIKVGGTNYSVDTVRSLLDAYPDSELHWILGADQIAQLHHWREIETLCQLTRFIAFEREGSSCSNADLPSHAKILFAPSRLIQISSTEIRERLKSGRDVKYFLPPPVFDYIKAENPYR